MRGTIQKRYTDSWRLQVYVGTDTNGRELRRSKTIRAPHTKAGRRTAETELAKMLATAGRHNTGTLTVSQLLDQWADMKRADWSPSTHATYRRRIDTRITPHLGDVPVAQLSARQIDAFYVTLAASGGKDGTPLSPSTVKAVHRTLAAALRQAVRWGEIDYPPTDAASPPRPTSHEIDPPGPDDIRRLLAVDVGPVWSTLLRLAVTTGARRGELAGLQWDDLDDASLTIRRGIVTDDGALVAKAPKNGRSRTLHLDDVTIEAVARLRTHRIETAFAAGTQPGPYLFTSEPDGTIPLHPDSITRWWTRHRARLALDDVRFHDLRHYCATRMLAAGVDVRTVAERLGHANPAITLQVYSHFVPARDREAAELLAAELDS